MNLHRAVRLQMRMPYKRIFLDAIHKCYRLIDTDELYEYKDAEGRRHKRQNVDSLIPIG